MGGARWSVGGSRGSQSKESLLSAHGKCELGVGRRGGERYVVTGKDVLAGAAGEKWGDLISLVPARRCACQHEAKGTRMNVHSQLLGSSQ